MPNIGRLRYTLPHLFNLGLPMSTVVTRFAPSPTGFLHLGSARTALFSWAYARRMGGRFILRIEDTDLERSSTEAVDAILEGMTWLGLDYDEGPFYQTKRMDRYKEAIELLLEKGQAYRCTCTKERLERLRTEQQARKEKPRYDGHCRTKNILADSPDSFVVRFANPHSGDVVINDAVHGKVVFANQELDDLIIARSDGVPTYNFCVVVDDWDMNVTHVIRGDDHLNNTPRQMNILEALGATIPVYAHLPMILGADGKRLSKRHGAVSVQEFQAQGILPEALLNYLARLGWSHGDTEIISLPDFVKLFDINDLNRSPSALNFEKLLWVNQQYLKTLPEAHIATLLQATLKDKGVATEYAVIEKIVPLLKERVKTMIEMADKSVFFFVRPTVSKEAIESIGQESRVALDAFKEALSTLPEWDVPHLHRILQTVAEAHQLSLGKLAQPLRILLTGGTVSPPIDATLAVLGRTETLARLA